MILDDDGEPMALGVIATHESTNGGRSRAVHALPTLQAAARRVSQDIHMVETLSSKAVVGDGLSPEVRAAVGEAFLLHVWSLREFFYGVRRGRAGVVAADYFASAAEWESVRPELPRGLGRDWHRLASAVQPVSRLDVDEDEDGGRCPYHRFTQELSEVNRRFLAALPPGRSAWFESEA